MTNPSATLAFIDVLFNLLLGITMMFIVAFLLINPPHNAGQIDPPVRLLVEMEWNPESYKDMDLWARGYDGVWVGFMRPDGRYFSLERDDRGAVTDTVVINGEEVVIKRNYEVITFSILPPGEYYINVHHYSGNGPETDIEVRLTSISPFKAIFSSKITLNPKQEITVVSFTVDEYGEIIDVRTDIQMPNMVGLPSFPNSIGLTP